MKRFTERVEHNGMGRINVESDAGVSRVWKDVSAGTTALLEGQDRSKQKAAGLYIPLHASD